MGTPNTDFIDAWLNAAAQGPYRIETQWTPRHAEAMVERIHDAITAPSQAILTSLGLLLTMAYRNATEGVPPGPDGFETQLAVALAQLSMARQLVDAVNLQTEAATFCAALAKPEDQRLLQAIFDAQDEGGLSQADLRALSITDVFTLRRALDRLSEMGALQTRGEGVEAKYVFSEDAEHEWSRRQSAMAAAAETS